MDAGDIITFEQDDFIFCLRYSNLKNLWILLDNQSTVDIFCNGKLLKNISVTENQMTIRSHRGTKTTNLIGDLQSYSNPVYYDPEEIANILLISNVIKQHRITYDSKGSDTFTINTRFPV